MELKMPDPGLHKSICSLALISRVSLFFYFLNAKICQYLPISATYLQPGRMDYIFGLQIKSADQLTCVNQFF